MVHSKHLFSLGALMLVIFFTGMTATAASMSEAEVVMFKKTADNFIVMYDSSNSMGDPYGKGDMRDIDAEKQILREKAATLPELDWKAGIYTFTPNWSTSYFKPFLTMRTYNKDEFTGVIEQLPDSPAGYTPLQGGLVGLGKELESLNGRTVVFLFTDGQYTNQPGFKSPGMIAKDISAKNDVCFQVISTSEDKANYEAIRNIAAASECSKVIPFEQLVGHPDWLTDVLFMVEAVEIAAIESNDKVVIGYEMENILFDFNKSEITKEGAKLLLELSIFMQENPQARVVLAGHTDSIGSDEYNMKLSKRRAESARAFLTQKALIKPDRVTLSWFGKADPMASNNTEGGRAQNRRVTAIITGM